MKLVTVTPLERASRKESLTYFSALDVSAGDVVSVSLRSKSVNAVVEEVKDASDEKSAIKTADFALKKITAVVARQAFASDFIAAVRETARFFATSTGSVLRSLMPSELVAAMPLAQTPLAEKAGPKEMRVIQADDGDRIVHYRSLVRESFMRGESVLMLVPSRVDADFAALALAKGIESFVHVLHGEKTKRARNKTVDEMKASDHPQLLIATGAFAGLLPPKTGLIIVERENASGFKQLVRPFIDYRFFAAALARSARIALVFGDAMLSVERLFIYEQSSMQETVPKWRITTKTERTLVDMRRYKPSIRGTVRSLSDELSALVTETRDAADRTFVFAARKGLAPTTICADCGTIVTCTRCSTPLVLHIGSDRKRSYLCRRCGERFDSSVRCRTCTSWKLASLGIGSELVEKDLKAAFPETRVLRLDAESASTRAQAERIVDEFYATPGAVLVGTELALPYLTESVGSTAIASIDELFSIPNFRINERVLYLALKIRSLANRHFLIQTRESEHPSIRSAMDGNLNRFYQEELEIRGMLEYPPFSIPIKISATGSAHELGERFSELSRLFAPYRLDIFPMLVKKGRGASGISSVVKIPRDAWPDDRILYILRSLPLSFEIAVDPESLL